MWIRDPLMQNQIRIRQNNRHPAASGSAALVDLLYYSLRCALSIFAKTFTQGAEYGTLYVLYLKKIGVDASPSENLLIGCKDEILETSVFDTYSPLIHCLYLSFFFCIHRIRFIFSLVQM